MNAVVTRNVRDGKNRLQHHAIVVGQISALPNVLPDTPDSREETARCESLRTQQHTFLHVLATLGNGAPKAFDLRVAHDPSSLAEKSLRVAVLARVSSAHSDADAENLAGQLWAQVEQSFPPSYDLHANLADERSFLDSVLPDREELDSAQIWELRKRPSRVKLANNSVVEVVGTYADHLDAMVEAWTAMARLPARALLAVRCIPLPKSDVNVNRIRRDLERLNDDTSQAQSGALDDARARFQDLMASPELMLLRVQLACWSGDPQTVSNAVRGIVATSAHAGRRGCDCQWHVEREEGLERARDDLTYMTADDIEANQEAWKSKAKEMVSVTEASALWRLPIAISRYDPVQGIPTRRIIPASPAAVPLGREERDEITLGAVVPTRSAPTEQRLPIDSLSRHLLIVGEVGSGKSTTTQLLVWQLWERGVPSLVIEPSSSQYADLWRLSSTFREAGHHLRLFPLGAPGEAGEALAFNPLCPQLGTSINAHIAYMTTCFAAALELPESWREIVRRALRAAYEEFGWQTTSNQPITQTDLNAKPWPSFADLIKSVEREILKYPRGEFRNNAEAGLLGRLRELLYGALGALVTTRRPLDLARLVQRPTIIELKSLGQDSRAKSLCMLFVLAHLREYYDSIPRSEHLTHLIVVEEAHRLLSPGYVNPPIGVNSNAEAVTMIADMLAEQRKQGIGLAIVEQLPTRLERVIPKLPVTKILHRLTAADDRDMMADAMNLTKDQARYVATMERGVVMFYTEGLSEPILLHIADPWGEQFATPGHQAQPTTADAQQQAHDEVVKSTLRDWQPPTASQRPWNPCDWCGCRCEYRMRALETRWWRRIDPDGEVVGTSQCSPDNVVGMREIADSLWKKVTQAAHDQKGLGAPELRCGLTILMEQRAMHFANLDTRQRAEQTIDRLLQAIDSSH